MLRRLIPVLLAAGALTLVGAPAFAADKDCKDFATQAEAQAYFEANGGSATNNVDGLDRDRDGVACEGLPTGGSQSSGPTSTTGGSNSGTNGGGGLPFTGSNDLLLVAVGAVLVIGGGFTVWALRHRPSH